MAEIHGGISFNVWFTNEMAFQVLGVIQQKFKQPFNDVGCSFNMSLD